MKMDIGDFRALLVSNGIKLGEVDFGSIDVVSIDGVSYGPDHPFRFLPCDLHDVVINGDWTVKYNGKDHVLWDMVQEDPFPVVGVVKCIRDNTRLGLRLSKEIVDAYRDIWPDYPEKSLIMGTSYKDLPLLIHKVHRAVPCQLLMDRLSCGE